MDLTYFNPRSQSEADFLASFVARTSVLEFFLNQLRGLEPRQSARHHLIVAPRGFGKTSLLRRIAIATRAEPGLRDRYMALTFREEQHNVISLDVFWRNCIESFLEAREDEGAAPEELASIDAAWSRLGPRQELRREDQDGAPAWEELRRRCDQLKRRPVLLIDNLDSLLAGLSDSHQWTLRRRLQQNDGPVLLAASSRYPDSTQKADASFFDFFRIETLDRLTNDEVLSCLRTIAGHRGESGKAVLELLDRNPGRIAALNTMAGGNPRTLSVLYGVLESHMSADVLSQLSAMLDTFTGWYQARTEELPMQARAVFDALALHWDPMTAAALGEATGLDTPSVSSQISRLEKLGFVEAVALSRRGRGRSGYQVAERFFNIWYLMRNGPRRARQKIKLLTVFLQSCFSASERRALGHRALSNDDLDPGYAVALADSIRDKDLRHRLLDRAESCCRPTVGYEDLKEVIQEIRQSIRGKSPFQARTDLSQGDDSIGADTGLESADSKTAGGPDAATLLQKMMTLAEGGDLSGVVAIWDRILTEFGEFSPLVAVSLIGKGMALSHLGKNEAAIEAYDQFLARFGDATGPRLREQVARVLVNKGVMLGQLGKREPEIEAYDQVLAQFGDATEPALRELVAYALFNEGVALGQLGKSDAAIKAYDQVVARFGDATEPALRERVARALFNKGVTLAQLGKREATIEACNQVLTRFGDAAVPALRERVAGALVNKGAILGQLGKSEAAIEACDQVLTRVGDAAEPALRELVAHALVNKGVTLGQLGKNEAEIEAYDQVLTRFGKATEPTLQEHVARALVNKGVTLGQLGKSGAEIEAYDQVLALFGEASEPALRKRVAIAHANSAYVMALFLDQRGEARSHAEAALAVDEGNFTPAAKALLKTLSMLTEAENVRWPSVYQGIADAVQSEDPELWSTYLDDLQRLLWFVIARGAGGDFQKWMEAADYPQTYAPLYHAFVAALGDDDHLLKVNPETRAPAERICAGIQRLLKLHGREKAPRRS